MQREKIKQNFMNTYGGPLSEFDLRKPIIIWYPSYFTLRRFIFVAVSLYLWEYPMTQLSFRMLMALIGFVILSQVRPYENPRTTSMEIMNEATSVLLIDLMFIFTDVLNEKNTRDLEKSRSFTGWFYIGIFSANIFVHLFVLAIT